MGHEHKTAYGGLYLNTIDGQNPDTASYASVRATLYGGADVHLACVPQDSGASLRDLITQLLDEGLPVFDAVGDLELLLDPPRLHLFRIHTAFSKKLLAETAELRLDPTPLLLRIRQGRPLDLCAQLVQSLGDRRAWLLHGPTTQIHGGRLSALADLLLPRGPVDAALLIHPPGPQDAELTAELLRLWADQQLSRGAVAKRLAARFQIDRAQAYALAGQTPDHGQTPVETTAVSFTFRGHEHLRGSHSKTLEFKREDQLNPKETCVVGVGASWSPEDVKRLRGTVEITIEVHLDDTHLSDQFQARICPRFNARDRMVFRKSGKQSEITFAVNAEKGAGDLSRDLKALLANPNTRGRVTIKAME